MQFIVSFSALVLAVMLSTMSTHAFMPKETAQYFNGPTVSSVTGDSAVFSLAPSVLADITNEEKKGVYFEYFETHQMCIMIYPTPEHCLPKKTEQGSTTVIVKGLKPNTSYTVTYKKDNTIMCVTSPCPENGFTSLSVEFLTKKVSLIENTASTSLYSFVRNLWVGSRGQDVATLQTMLAEGGYFKGEPTGYFGGLTMKAVRAFQKEYGLPETGYFGPLTRQSIGKYPHKDKKDGEVFEGKVTGYSTACFADGECSITVDGKKVVTTIGWSQAIVGKVTGIPDFGSIENNVGAHAKVYAKKTEDGYTLYGNAKYYVHITSKNAKLPASSLPSGDAKDMVGHTWKWQKIVMTDGTIITPRTSGAFTIIFTKDGSLSGKTDCNGFFGSYTLGSDGILKMGPLGSTLMFCDGSQESVYTGAIAKVDRYGIDATGNLVLLLAGNEGSIFFSKK